jgi:hypothetical protein
MEKRRKKEKKIEKKIKRENMNDKGRQNDKDIYKSMLFIQYT